MEKAFKGMQGNMVPATFISRTVAEGETVGAGAPVQLGGERRQVKAATSGEGFEGIHCPTSIVQDGEEFQSIRIITQGVVYVEVAGSVSAGDEVGFDSSGEFGVADDSDYTNRIVGAKFDDAAEAGELAPVRLMGTEIEDVEDVEDTE